MVKKFFLARQNLEDAVTDPFRKKFNVNKCDKRTRQMILTE